MKETTRIATVELTYIMNEEDMKERNLSLKSKEDHKRYLERLFQMQAGNENVVAKVTNIQDFVMEKDEPKQREVVYAITESRLKAIDRLYNDFAAQLEEILKG